MRGVLKSFAAPTDTRYPIGKQAKKKLTFLVNFIVFGCQWFVFFTATFLLLYILYNIVPADKAVDPRGAALLLSAITATSAMIVKELPINSPSSKEWEE